MTEGGWHKITLEGPPAPAPLLVFLPGWGQSHQSVLPLARLLSPRFAARLYDLPGFGATPMLASGAGTADYADALAPLLPLGRPVILVGHSFGARVAIQCAARHPSRVAGLILIAGAGLQKKRSPAFRLKAFGLRQLGRAARALDGLIGSRLGAAYGARFGSRDYRAAGGLRPTFVSVVREDLAPLAAALEKPVLLLYGADDSETPPEFGERYASLIPGSELHILKGFGHLDILRRGGYQCEHLIGSFLERFPR